ncbi:MAG: nucleoside phosphorylase [Erysipelotrichaceae bacterium]|nr:nucleoside phosphorylase [Erysipelotrichaceae bacterium]
MLLKQFSPERRAIINPEDLITHDDTFPKTVISCFSHVTFDRMVRETGGVAKWELGCANTVASVYEIEYKGVKMALVNADVGAPACVALFEDVYVLGAENIVLFGTCGVLDSSIGDCAVIIPYRAMRDEGTSYHYLEASDEVEVNAQYGPLFEKLLRELKVSYHTGKVWTTDGVYRETRDKMERRKAEGCICVDMECSAMSALALFRGKGLLHFFYSADNLDGEQWDRRSLGNHDNLEDKDRIAYLALEAGYRIEKERMK